MKNFTFYKKPPELLDINGYNLLILPVKTKVSLIECCLLGGSYFETKKNAGISHLLEHVLTSAWKKCRLNKCELYWEKYGVNSNASTGTSMNRYWIRGLSVFFDKMFEYIVDTMLRPVFTKALIEKEKNAVENELKGLMNHPSWKLDDATDKHLFTEGGMKYTSDYKLQLALLKPLTKKKLMNYLNSFYTKENLLFIVSSNIPREEIMRKFKELTLGLKKRGHITMGREFCIREKKKIIFIREPKAKNTDIEICFPLKMYINDKDHVYLDTIASIVAGDLNSLLLRILREKLQLVYGISCFVHTVMCGSVVYIQTSTLDKNVEQVIHTIFEICALYSHKLITNNKLLHIRRQFKTNVYQQNLSSVNAVRDFYAVQFLYQLNAKHLEIYTLGDKIKKLNSLTKQKVSKLIRTMFNPDECLVVYQGKKKYNISI